MYRNFIDIENKKKKKNHESITKKYSNLSINILYRVWSTNGIPSKCVWKLEARPDNSRFSGMKKELSEGDK